MMTMMTMMLLYYYYSIGNRTLRMVWVYNVPNRRIITYLLYSYLYTAAISSPDEFLLELSCGHTHTQTESQTDRQTY